MKLKDARTNRQWKSSGKRFLVVRHAARQPYFYQQFLEFVAGNYPNLRRLFELHLLPCRLRDPSKYVLQIPWIQDPLEDWSPRGYRQALRLQRDCVRHGVPIVNNRLDSHKNASKLEGARRIAYAGFPTPRMAPIADLQHFQNTLCGLELPLLVRENHGHGGTSFLVRSPADIAEIPWHKYRAPLAVEFIDVCSPRDGAIRRYRFFAGGNIGISQAIHFSLDWESRRCNRVYSNLADDEEYEYVTTPNPHCEQFLEARRFLGLDLVGFDYSYDSEGKIVVWGANPYPFVSLSSRGNRVHAPWLTARTFAVMLSCYLQKARLTLPDGLREFTEGQTKTLAEAA